MTDTMPVVRQVKGIGRELTVQQELACALRILAHEGWQEYLSGHITWAREGGEFWCNPWGIWWEETQASDILLVDLEGEIVEGKWPVTGAVNLHTELHRERADAVVIIHGHPYWATLLAGLGVKPEIIHQNSAILEGDIAFVDEYDGLIGSPDAGQKLADAVGHATGVVLANHGAIVTGTTVQEACYQAVMFERMCKFYYHSMISGRQARILTEDITGPIKGVLKRGCPDVYWHGAVRQLLKSEPDVLD